LNDPTAQPDLPPARYREVAPLGEGAFGRVYRATAPDGRPSAVKVLAPALASRPEAAWLFAGEYRKLARLAHPAFPAAIEEGHTESGSPFYAMALAEGDAPSPGLSADRVRALVAAVADGLAYLHGLGWTHGDLKPDNLRVTPDGRVTLLDVGMMAPVGARRETVAGTLEYLAPEALRKAPVDPAADMYALGALAFELWTGRTPFVGGPTELIRAHLQAPVPPVGAAPADAELERLVRSLLAKDPADRPSALAMLAALGRDVDPALLAGAGRGLRGGSFVGRREALDAWREALDGPDRWVAVTAEFGLGKSRLLDEYRVAAQLAGRAWVGAAGAGAGGAPAGPLRTVVAQAIALAGLNPDSTVAAWLAGHIAPELESLEPAARLVAVGRALGATLEAAATTLGGLAVGLDDYHLADTATRDLVTFLARATPDAPLAWALAGEPTESACPGRAVALAPFGPAEIREAVEARLGGAAPTGLLPHLASGAAGSPLAVDLLLETLVATGALRPAAGGWTFDASAGGASPGGVSSTLEAVWSDRLAALPEDARSLAGWAGLAQRAGGFPAASLLAAAHSPDSALDSLIATGWLIEADGRVRLAMPAAAEFLAGRVREADTAPRLTTLARALVGATPPDALDAETLNGAATLAWGADDDLLALALTAEAGRRCLALGAPAEARAHLAQAKRRLPPEAGPSSRLAVVLPLAEASRLLDALDAALPDYEAATELAAAIPDDRAGARAWIGLGKIRQLQGDYPGALAALAEAETAAGRAGDRAQQARALAAEARMRAFKGEAARGLAQCERAAELAREADAPAILAQALNLQGYLLIHEDLEAADRARAMLDEAIALSTAIGDRVGLGQALDNLGNAELALGNLAAAADAFARYAENCRAIGAQVELIAANLNQAIVAAERGDTDAALRLGRGVAERAAKAGRKFLMGAALAAVGQALWRAGRPDEALAPLDEGLGIAQSIQNKLLEEHVRMFRLEALLATGDLGAARAEADLVGALNAASHNAEMTDRLDGHRGELARLTGDMDAARGHVARLLDSPNRLAAHRAHQIVAEVDWAEGNLVAAAGHAEAALAIARTWQAPWHEAIDQRLLDRARGVTPPAAPTPAMPVAGLHIAPQALLAHLEALAAAEDEAAISRATLQGALEMARADRGYLLAYEAGRLRQAVTSGIDYEAEVASGFSQSIVERVLFTQTPLYVTDASADETWRQATSVMALQLKTVICLPLATPSRILGVIYLDRESLDPVLTESDVAMLQAFALAAASAIVRERDRAELALAAAIAQGLGAQLAAQLPPHAAKLELLAAAIETAGAERGFWLVPDGESWSAALGRDRDGRDIPYRDVSRGVIDAVATTGDPVGILDLGATEGWQERQSIQALGLRTVWCLAAGTPDGALLYLDTTAMATSDPALALQGLETLLRHAGPLLS
jgi:GAF domain-containing protein